MKKNKKWSDDLSQPVDPATFLMITQAYLATAELATSVNPETTGLKMDSAKSLAKDTSIYEGLLAANSQLQQMDAQPICAYICRLMNLGEILEAREVFRDFIKPSNEGDDVVMISGALIKAAATARIMVSKREISFDFEDLLRVAHEVETEEHDKATQF